MSVTRCGECGEQIADVARLAPRPGRCMCGRRAAERTELVTLIHAPECTGEDGVLCSCFRSLHGSEPQSFLDGMRLCAGGLPRGDRY